MGIYVYIGRDGPRGRELRATAVRERHLANLERLEAAGRILFAGPLRAEDGTPEGSVIVLRAESFAEARDIAESDPYLEEGVFERIEVHESTQVFPRS